MYQVIGGLFVSHLIRRIFEIGCLYWNKIRYVIFSLLFKLIYLSIVSIIQLTGKILQLIKSNWSENDAKQFESVTFVPKEVLRFHQTTRGEWISNFSFTLFLKVLFYFYPITIFIWNGENEGNLMIEQMIFNLKYKDFKSGDGHVLAANSHFYKKHFWQWIKLFS